MKEGGILKNHSLGAMLKFSNRLLEKNVNNKMCNFNITRSQMELLAYVFIQNEEGNEVNQVDIEKYLNPDHEKISYSKSNTFSIKGTFNINKEGYKNKYWYLKIDKNAIFNKKVNKFSELLNEARNGIIIK